MRTIIPSPLISLTEEGEVLLQLVKSGQEKLQNLVDHENRKAVSEKENRDAMVLVDAARNYINRMFQDISGMKILILDAATVSIVSVVYSQSELLQKEVFLVELIDSISMSKEPMSHLKAVYFLRPTSDNIQYMRRQLTKPRFGEYHLFFSNMLNDTQLHNLADSDEHEVVHQVQEFYADFVASDPYHFTLNMASNHMYMVPAVVDPSRLQHFCERVVDGIAALFLVLKKRPVIRYSRTSDIAKRVAHEASKLMYQQETSLFDFRRTEYSPLLLVVDRRDDPVTPLLNQWTYQAMVHELIGIQDNKVDLKNVGNLPKDQQEVVLSSEQDVFFKKNMFNNFGDIGKNIKDMVDDFQKISKSNQTIQTLEDMTKFVDNYPEYRKMHGNVSKHVTVVTELSKIVAERKLMLVSETEQELACNGGQGAAFEAVTNFLNDDGVSDIDRLRLVMLYALRYEKESAVQLMQLFNILASRSPKYKPGLVQFLLKQAGVDKRTGDLYGNRDFLNIARNMAQVLKGVENVYTQHQPLLFQIMESITKGRLKDVDYPFVGNHFQQARLQEVIIFIIGGTTYEESRCVAQHNASNSGIRFILGGSAILNSKRFLKDLEEAQRIARTSTNMV